MSPRIGEVWVVRPDDTEAEVTARVTWVSHGAEVIEGRTPKGEFVRRGRFAWLQRVDQ